MDCHKELDKSDAEYDCIKKIFDLVAGPADYNMRLADLPRFEPETVSLQ